MNIDSRHRTILATFLRHHVAFVLIGGVACQLHGWTQPTKDIDLTVADDEHNVARVNAALAELGARAPAIGALGSSFRTPLGRIDLLRRAHGVGSYEAWRARAQLIDIGDGLTLHVAHPDDILRSKEDANRDKDRQQLPAIRRDLIAAGTLTAIATARHAPQTQATNLTATHLVRLLGERPTSENAGRVWDRAAAAINAYRSRHAIADSADPLGPTPPHGTRQAAERQQLQRALQRVRHTIQRDQPPTT